MKAIKCENARRLAKTECAEDGNELNTNQETYKIYDYLKKNLGVIVGSSAAVMAALSALLTFCNYLSESAMLKYWNVDLVYIDLNTPNRIYATIASFLFLCVIAVMFSVIDMIAEKTAPFRSMVVYLKRTQKEYRLLKKKVLMAKIEERVLKKKRNEQQRNHLNWAKEETGKLKDKVRKAHKVMRKQVGAHIALLEIMLTLSAYIYLSIGLANYSVTKIDNFIALSLICLFLILLFYYVTRNSFVKKEEIRDKAVQDFENMELQDEIPNVTFPLKKFFMGEYSIRKSDQQLKRVLAVFLLGMIVLVTALVMCYQWFGYLKAADQKQFLIVTEKETQYAVVYNTDENAILAKCKLVDGIFIIDTDCQRVVPVAGLEYEIKEYGKVEKGEIP